MTIFLVTNDSPDLVIYAVFTDRNRAQRWIDQQVAWQANWPSRLIIQEYEADPDWPDDGTTDADGLDG